MPDFFVIAEEELVLAFRMAGAGGQAVSGRDEALVAFRRAIGRSSGPDGPDAGRPKILVLMEDVADMIGDEAREWQAGGEYPLIVEIPGQGRRREGRKGLADLVREAVGVSI
jgi:vacuolar-type H+-ATPase subunit F/Vma7